MNKKSAQRMAMAAIAGMTMGLASPAPVLAQDADKPETVKCFGVNGCHAQAKCAVKPEDIAAVRAIVGDAEFNKRFGKTKTHSCAAHAKCGSNQKILNWTPLSAEACQTQGGFVIDSSKK